MKIPSTTHDIIYLSNYLCNFGLYQWNSSAFTDFKTHFTYILLNFQILSKGSSRKINRLRNTDIYTVTKQMSSRQDQNEAKRRESRLTTLQVHKTYHKTKLPPIFYKLSFFQMLLEPPNCHQRAHQRLKNITRFVCQSSTSINVLVPQDDDSSRKCRIRTDPFEYGGLPVTG